MLRPDKWGLQFYFLMLTFLSPPDPFNDWGGRSGDAVGDIRIVGCHVAFLLVGTGRGCRDMLIIRERRCFDRISGVSSFTFLC